MGSIIETTTSLLSPLMQSYYDKRLLKRVDNLTILEQLGQKRPLPAGEGKTITFSRYKNLALDVSTVQALTEGVNPSAVGISAENVTGTIAQYGKVTKITSLVSATALDRNISQKVPILGEWMGSTVEAISRNVIAAGFTDQQVLTASHITDITATDVITGNDLRKALRTLRNNKAMTYGDGYFATVLEPFLEYDFMADTTWVLAAQYGAQSKLFKGEIGKWFGQRIVMTTLPFRCDATTAARDTYSSTGAVHNAMVCGSEAFGITELDTLKKQMIIKIPGNQDTSNSLNMFSTAGVKFSYLSKVLNANFGVRILCGATA
jgi:N4-gp56 family major capsid protein